MSGPPARDRLMIFAKAPVPGQVKTRLAPALGIERAAALHAAFVGDVVERHARAGRGLTLWRAGGTRHPLWAALAVAGAPAQRDQRGADLGARMAHAFAAELASAERVVVLGSDSPTLPPARVDEAFEALGVHDAVLGPATDGGYYLLGLRRPMPELLRALPWGTDAVLPATLRRLEASGRPYRVLPFWYDVDRPGDLALLRAHLPALEIAGVPAPPRTRALLARWPEDDGLGAAGESEDEL